MLYILGIYYIFDLRVGPLFIIRLIRDVSENIDNAQEFVQILCLFVRTISFATACSGE